MHTSETCPHALRHSTRPSLLFMVSVGRSEQPLLNPSHINYPQFLARPVTNLRRRRRITLHSKFASDAELRFCLRLPPSSAPPPLQRIAAPLTESVNLFFRFEQTELVSSVNPLSAATCSGAKKCQWSVILDEARARFTRTAAAGILLSLFSSYVAN